MCGIFAGFGRDKVLDALAALRHRGPDGSRMMTRAAWPRTFFHIGFTHLRIKDTRSPDAEQPFESRTGRITVLNGELYNYKHIDPLTPSEVVLVTSLIDEHLDPRQHLDGDYAILSYDPGAQRVTLYRDRFGSCPLYYQTRPDIAVSSERRLLDNPREVPAHGRIVLDLRKSRVVSRDVMRHYGAVAGDVKMSTLADTFVEAVRSRAMHSDAHAFSVAYSGGIDSSLILYALRALDLQPRALLTTFFANGSEDLYWARLMAGMLRMPLLSFQVGIESSEERQRILEHLDSAKPPTALRWRGALRTWCVAKHSPTRVVLTGDGADELVGGYPQHWGMLGPHRAPPTWRSPHPYRVTARCLTSIRSMPVMNLDRTNKMGMAHSKEFRSPFLASSLSYMLLGATRLPNKQLLRDLLRYMGAPAGLCARSKYSPDELAVTEVPA